MAKQNSVYLLGYVLAKPEIRDGGLDYKIARCRIIVSKSSLSPQERGNKKAYFAVPEVIGKTEDIVKEMSQWKANDLVYIDGFLATKDEPKRFHCPDCGKIITKKTLRTMLPDMNINLEEQIDNDVREQGTTVYIYPKDAVHIDLPHETKLKYAPKEEEVNERMAKFNLPPESRDYKAKKQVITEDMTMKNIVSKFSDYSNSLIIIGNLVREPEKAELKSKKSCTKYQIATNRKYCAGNIDEIDERSDYPWAYSYGEIADMDAEVLHKGAEVIIEGMIQTRSYTDVCKCECGGEAKVPAYATEIYVKHIEYRSGYDAERYVKLLKEANQKQ